jgi:hypothetical protein
MKYAADCNGLYARFASAATIPPVAAVQQMFRPTASTLVKASTHSTDAARKAGDRNGPVDHVLCTPGWSADE